MFQDFNKITKKLWFRCLVEHLNHSFFVRLIKVELARERELHVDIIKLDKYFADDLLVHKENEIIAGDIISMMHKLGHSVVAEGVECEEQKEYLIKHDCDYLQGYLFSKPVKSEKALELLKESDWFILTFEKRCYIF